MKKLVLSEDQYNRLFEKETNSRTTTNMDTNG